jgi:hypothetical protein
VALGAVAAGVELVPHGEHGDAQPRAVTSSSFAVVVSEAAATADKPSHFH